MNEIYCIDETFDINSTGSYHLSIQVSFDGLSFCILNTINNKYILLKRYLFPDISEEVIYEKIEKLLDEDEFLNLQYKSISALYQSGKYTIIPSKLFEPEKARHFYELNFKLSDLEEIHYSKLKNLDAFLLFSVPSQITNPLIRKFNKIKFYHHSHPLIDEALTYTRMHLLYTYFFAQFDDKNLDIVVVSKGKLLFHNSFRNLSPQNVLFYLFYIIKQYNLDKKQVQIMLSGDITKSSEAFKLLNKYFQQIKFQLPKKEFVYSYTFNKIPGHTFINLLNLFSCES